MTDPFTFTITGASGLPIDLEAYEIPGHPGILATVLEGRWGVMHRKSGLGFVRLPRYPDADYVACVSQAFDVDPGLVAEIDAVIPDGHEPGVPLADEVESATLSLGLQDRGDAIRDAYSQAVKTAKIEALQARGEHIVALEIVRRATVLVAVDAVSPAAAVAVARDLPGRHLTYVDDYDDPEVECAYIDSSGELPVLRFGSHGDPR